MAYSPFNTRFVEGILFDQLQCVLQVLPSATEFFFLFEKAKIVCSKTFLPHFFLFCICKIYIFSVLYVVMRRLLLISVVVHFYILQHREM